jgi:hypothetical protein
MVNHLPLLVLTNFKAPVNPFCFFGKGVLPDASLHHQSKKHKTKNKKHSLKHTK